MPSACLRYLQRLLLASAVLQSGVSLAEKSAMQAHSAIREAAHHFLAQQNADTSGEIAIEVNRLDPRLRLSRCDQALEAFLPAAGKTIGRVTVGVRCNGSSPWSLYLPARVQRFDDVVIANRKLTRGQAIQAGDLRLERRDVSRLRRGYFQHIARAAGKIAERDVARGKVLSPSQIRMPDAITRGSEVSIVANIGGIQARMKGRALRNGVLGERIPVKNISSNRELEARIISAGTVRVDI
jgi:flagella basal body P-ring formation protein FlgA